MRKRIKTKIIDILNTLGKAHQHVELLLQKGMVQEAADMLAKCQECALEAGSTIEKSDGMGTKAVSGLEEYCELLYQMSQVAERKAVKNLKRQIEGVLRKVERSLEELPLEPVKVVFMPYKASMWDCLESIWEAADADKDCIAYVVPIPFVEKNAQGGVEKECYEGDMFPKEVPIIHYSQFSLEQEEPEIIYIHNPYDNGNYVTSVYPEYYSFQLKKYTDMLVYIPYYFNGNGPMPDGHQDLPVYHYADKIILQDKEKVESLADESLRAKAVAMGSPKVDRLLKLEKRRDEIIEKEICAEWREKIRGKKVILYNISVSGILQNSEYAMEKIRYVLSRFRGRDDVVLWWRPHPLIEGTLKSMRPKLYGEYMQIKNAFLREGKGILDESGDAGVAAVVADAYLGEDTSSLVHYFGVLGKPVMFTDWKVVTEWCEEERASLFFTDCFIEDGFAWFVPRSLLGYYYLCKMDLESGKVILAYELPGEIRNPAKGGAYFSIFKINDDIVLLPVWSNDIYIYRLNTGQAIKIPLAIENVQPNMSRAFFYHDRVFLAPRNYPAVIELDIQTGHLTYYDVPDNHEDIIDGAEYLFGVDAAVAGNKLYIPCVNKSAILIFNMDTGEFLEKKINGVNCGFYSLTCIKNEIWAVGDKVSDIICWNIKTDVVDIWKQILNKNSEGMQPFCKVVKSEDGIILFPKTANAAFKIDKENRNVIEYHIRGSSVNKIKLVNSKKDIINFLMVKECGEKTIALTEEGFQFLQYDIKDGKGILYPCRLEEDDRKNLEKVELDIFFQAYRLPNYCIENERWSISVFLNYIGDNRYNHYKKSQEIYQRVLGNMDGKCGEEIHKFIRNELWKV